MNDLLHQDCRYFRSDRPCVPHKESGVTCGVCEEYDPISFRILIIKLGSDGDVLRTTCLLPGLRKKYARAHITWVTEKTAAPLLKNNPDVDILWDAPSTKMPELLALPFSLVINPDADVKSCALASLVKAKEKRGFDLNETGNVIPLSRHAEAWFRMGMNDDLKRKNRKSYPEILHEIAGVDMATPRPQLYLKSKEIKNARAYLSSCGWDGDHEKTIVGINTGAGRRWRRKSLPVSMLEKAIEKILKTFNSTTVFLLGGPEEKEKNERLRDVFGKRIIYTGTDNSICNYAAIISFLDILITPDSLAMHIGTALDRCIIVHFGPTSPWEIDVFGKGEKLIPELSCICCYRHDCDIYPACNESISPETICVTLENTFMRTTRIKDFAFLFFIVIGLWL